MSTCYLLRTQMANPVDPVTMSQQSCKEIQKHCDTKALNKLAVDLQCVYITLSSQDYGAELDSVVTLQRHIERRLPYYISTRWSEIARNHLHDSH